MNENLENNSNNNGEYAIFYFTHFIHNLFSELPFRKRLKGEINSVGINPDTPTSLPIRKRITTENTEIETPNSIPLDQTSNDLPSTSLDNKDEESENEEDVQVISIVIINSINC